MAVSLRFRPSWTCGHLKAECDRVRIVSLSFVDIVGAMFPEIIQNCPMKQDKNEHNCLQVPFSSKVYLIAVTLDSQFSL